MHIQMFTIHGLVRAKDLELGIDRDTGGQIVYVLELAKALSQFEEIEKIEIITRQIIDPRHPGYDQPREAVNQKTDIVRLGCGPRGYIKKAELWLYLDELVEKIKKYNQEKNQLPHLFYSHYADGGYVGTRLSQELGRPQVHTAHSLAKPELLELERSNNLGPGEKEFLEKQIIQEQKTIDQAEAIIVSSEHEKKHQYGLYQISNPAKFVIIPPSIDLDRFVPYQPSEEKPGQPIVLSLSRIEQKKNFTGLVQAFAQDQELAQAARLLISSSCLGLAEPEPQAEAIIKEIKQIIQDHNLEEVVTLSCPIKPDKVDDIYRRAAQTKGVFVNPALFEGFGLTTLEAAASGLPVVITQNSGSAEVVEKCQCGLLVDPTKPREIAKAIKQVILNPSKWQQFSENGIKNIRQYFSWSASATKALALFQKIVKEKSR